nr:hypothetical protein CFP56_75427 [Quercus suber]
MEATAWRLDRKSYGGGVEVMGLFLGFQRGFVHGFPAFGLAFGWCLAFGVSVEDDDDDDRFGMNRDDDG